MTTLLIILFIALLVLIEQYPIILKKVVTGAAIGLIVWVVMRLL